MTLNSGKPNGGSKSVNGDTVRQSARLFSIDGINNATEAENRATTTLLAILRVVPDFANRLLAPLGSPVIKQSNIETFIQGRYKTGEQEVTAIPDGVIEVVGRTSKWVALLEVKTGRNVLTSAQLETYLDVIHEQKYDALITISNEITATGNTHPTNVDRRKIGNVRMVHLSWAEILFAAVTLEKHKRIDDFEQSWLLSELVRYLNNEKSGALTFNDMGDSWVAVRDALDEGMLSAADKDAIDDVGNHFDALIRYSSFIVSADLGEPVLPVFTKAEKENPSLRLQSLNKSLLNGV